MYRTNRDWNDINHNYLKIYEKYHLNCAWWQLGARDLVNRQLVWLSLMEVSFVLSVFGYYYKMSVHVFQPTQRLEKVKRE